MTNKEFVMNVCHCDEHDSIMWKPYKYGRHVENISLEKAVAIIEQDTKELQELGLLTDEQCVEGARNIFKKHLFIAKSHKKGKRI